MEMPIYMIERQTRRFESPELLMNLRPQLFFQTAPEEIIEAGSPGAVCEFSAFIYQARDFCPRKRGAPAKEGKMKANAKGGIGFGQSDRFVATWFVYH